MGKETLMGKEMEKMGGLVEKMMGMEEIRTRGKKREGWGIFKRGNSFYGITCGQPR